MPVYHVWLQTDAGERQYTVGACDGLAAQQDAEDRARRDGARRIDMVELREGGAKARAKRTREAR